MFGMIIRSRTNNNLFCCWMDDCLRFFLSCLMVNICGGTEEDRMRTVREVLAEQAGTSVWAQVEQVKVDTSHAAAQHALSLAQKGGYTGGKLDGFGAYDATLGGNFSLRFDGPVHFSVDWVIDQREALIEVARDGGRLVDRFERSYTAKAAQVTAQAIGAFVARAIEDAEKEQGQ
jgi:hypothetical protein